MKRSFSTFKSFFGRNAYREPMKVLKGAHEGAKRVPGSPEKGPLVVLGMPRLLKDAMLHVH